MRCEIQDCAYKSTNFATLKMLTQCLHKVRMVYLRSEVVLLVVNKSHKDRNKKKIEKMKKNEKKR